MKVTSDYILVCMLFMHIVDDYYLQGILASMKQKEWWKKNAPNPKYKNDYILALLMHGFSWSFMIQLPIMVFCNKYSLAFLIYNAIVHANIDDEKANKSTLNLIEDQIIHIVQILVTWCLVVL